MGKEPQKDFIEEKLDEINEEIEKIDNSKIMRAAQSLIEKKGRLMAARRALLGAGNKVTGEGGSRVTQAEVVEWFKNGHDGFYNVGAIAQQMGHPEATIRGHLNRGKGERFTKHDDGTWSLRDPKSEPADEDDDE